MRRAILCAACLLCCGAMIARGKPEPLVFVFHHVDHEQGIAYLRPMVAPDIGVQLAPGPRQLALGAVLRCIQSTHTQNALVDGQSATVSELVLDCGDQKFVVKGLDFSGRATSQ